MFCVNEEKYASALLKNGICSTIEEARKEAKRYNLKASSGFLEPLKCYPDPDVKIDSEVKKDGSMYLTFQKEK